MQKLNITVVATCCLAAVSSWWIICYGHIVRVSNKIDNIYKMFNGLILCYACTTLCWVLCPRAFICINTYTCVPHTQYAHDMHKPDCQSLICSLNIYLYTYHRVPFYEGYKFCDWTEKGNLRKQFLQIYIGNACVVRPLFCAGALSLSV